jgi:type II secretory pathway pseudopilin PulG
MQLTRSQLRRKDQRGYVLLAILFALTLLIIGLAAAAPSAATALKRTKEDELVRRGQQYSLAIRRFYKKFGRYPSDIDQLESTNNIRFLRRRYLDPLTGKDDWKPIQFGQARPSLGFFGEKVTTTGGASPSGPGLGPSTIGTSSGGPSDSNSSNPSTPGSTAPGAPGTGPSGGKGSSPAGPAGSAGNPLSTDQLSGKTFGGGAIVGVSVPSQKESLKEFQQKNHYNEWQFVYDPTMDPTTRGALGTAGAGGVGVPGIGGTNPGGLNPQQPGLNPQQPGGLNPSPNPGPAGTGSANPNPR